MKNLKLLALLLAILITACDNNDDAVTPTITPTDGFTYNNTFYETANAYINIDEDDDNNDGRPDNYTFFFTDGRIYDNDNNANGSSAEYLYSLNTTKLAFLNILTSDNPSLANAGLLPNTTYIVSSIEDTVIIHDGQIEPLVPPFTSSNIGFGEGNENVGTFHLPGPVVPTITFNALNIDNNNPANSTIDADYTLRNTNGEIITGHYTGTFGIILD